MREGGWVCSVGEVRQHACSPAHGQATDTRQTRGRQARTHKQDTEHEYAGHGETETGAQSTYVGGHRPRGRAYRASIMWQRRGREFWMEALSRGPAKLLEDKEVEAVAVRDSPPMVVRAYVCARMEG